MHQTNERTHTQTLLCDHCHRTIHSKIILASSARSSTLNTFTNAHAHIIANINKHTCDNAHALTHTLTTARARARSRTRTCPRGLGFQGAGDLNGSEVQDVGLSHQDLVDLQDNWTANMAVVKVSTAPHPHPAQIPTRTHGPHQGNAAPRTHGHTLARIHARTHTHGRPRAHNHGT